MKYLHFVLDAYLLRQKPRFGALDAQHVIFVNPVVQRIYPVILIGSNPVPPSRIQLPQSMDIRRGLFQLQQVPQIKAVSLEDIKERFTFLYGSGYFTRILLFLTGFLLLLRQVEIAPNNYEGNKYDNRHYRNIPHGSSFIPSKRTDAKRL